MRAIVLPGLDGSSDLRVEFVDALSPQIHASVVSFPPDEPMDYAALEAFVRGRLPRDRPFVLVGESFSGPLAIRLAASHPPGLAGLALCASFASAPVPFAGLIRRVATQLSMRSVPMPLVERVMLGRWSSPAWTARLRRAIDDLADSVVAARIDAALAADGRDALSRITCPVLYLRAASDRVLLRDPWPAIRRAQPGATRVAVPGPHMLLQAQPVAAAQFIKRWLGLA